VLDNPASSGIIDVLCYGDIMNFNSEKPTQSALYLVDRGMQGKMYRYYNADNDTWGLCGADMNEAMQNKDTQSPVGFFPWVGPLTGPKFPVNKPDVVEMTLPLVKASKATKSVVTKAPKVAKTTSTKQTYADGTVFYRADRQKWVAVWANKQEAARPTKEACIKFLEKKYNLKNPIVIEA